jgi:hypothetical protein
MVGVSDSGCEGAVRISVDYPLRYMHAPVSALGPRAESSLRLCAYVFFDGVGGTLVGDIAVPVQMHMSRSFAYSSRALKRAIGNKKIMLERKRVSSKWTFALGTASSSSSEDDVRQLRSMVESLCRGR